MKKANTAVALVTASLLVIQNPEGDIIGTVLHKGKHVRLAKYNGGGLFIEDHEGNTVLAASSESPVALTVDELTEVAKAVDRAVEKKAKAGAPVGVVEQTEAEAPG